MTLLFYPILVNRDCKQPLIRNHACPLLINPSMESTFPKNEEFKQVSGPSTVRPLYSKAPLLDGRTPFVMWPQFVCITYHLHY